MRRELDASRLGSLLAEIGRAAKGPGCVYLTGGTSAVLMGWRPATIDANLKFGPEPRGVFEALRNIKETLELNVELASPDDFIPTLPGWRERSHFIARHGQVEFYHYDFYAQALAKIERGHDRDLFDAHQMVGRGLIEPARLAKCWDSIEENLVRFPAIDADVFRRKLEEFLAEASRE